MKRFLTLLFVIMCVCIFTAVASAYTVSFVDEGGNEVYSYVTLNDNDTKNYTVSHTEQNPFLKYDAEGDALTYYVSATATDTTNGTKYIYTVKSDKTKNLITVTDGSVSFNDSKIFKNIVSVAFDESSGITSFSKELFKKANGVSEESKLLFIHFPDSLVTINDGAFRNATALLQCYISESSRLTDFGAGSFWGATSLRSIYIPKEVTSLRTTFTSDAYWEEGLFCKCYSLSSITFAQDAKLTLLEKGTFNECNSLVSVTLPNSVRTLQPRVFAKCSNLEYVSFGGGLVEIVRYDANGTKLDDYVSMFQNSTKVHTVVIPYTFNAENLTNDLHTTFAYYGSTPYTIYYSGTEADFVALQEKFAKATNGSGNKALTKGTYRYINHCDAFLGGNHTEGALENYQTICTVYNCNTVVFCENPEHDICVNITYEKYTEAGVRKVNCLTCETKAKSSAVQALITFNGYSKKMDGSSLCAGFYIDRAAISEYKSASNFSGTFEYGLTLASATKAPDYMPLKLGQDGKVEAQSSCIFKLSIDQDNLSCVDLRIVGDFSKYQDHEFLMSMYIYNGEDIVYIQGHDKQTTQSSTASPITIASVAQAN
ncbi:MAG: leucine-rich repeat domain-containing protein [Clostridia bacterium]|nr:leucine-rich repeat domain-containing protein [Clostridia bacterium]